MKKLFYWGLLGLILFEFLKVYFIMPLPGSQTVDSIGVAYFLNEYRWIFRVIFLYCIISGLIKLFKNNVKWLPLFTLVVAFILMYGLNFKMMADKMFLQPQTIQLKSKSGNKIDGSRLIIGVANNGEAKAYPIEFLTYHHQIQDSIGGKPIIITYCSVCHTGRVYSPIVKGHYEKFRLVGMDHFNAMFEDATTKSWWRQSTGEAIAGSLKGEVLPEITSVQMTIDKWYELYPDGLVMQADSFSLMQYDSLANFEQGKSKGNLTRTDSLSWKDKSWVIGVEIGNVCKAYDWNELKQKHIINDVIGTHNIVIAISSDEKSFVAYERPSNAIFKISHDTLFSVNENYNFFGKELLNHVSELKTINAHQEFWHSWKTFHPTTLK